MNAGALAVSMRADSMHRDRIAELEAALKPFALIDGVAVSRIRGLPPADDRLWSYYDSRSEVQHEITRAHIIEAGRVLANKI
jgi:hypothetical protein